MNNSEDFCIKEFKNEKKIIVFFGSIHLKSINQINSIREIILKLNPEIILVEGNYHLANFKSEKESIKIGSETGYASFLAKNRTIQLGSNDPSFSEDISFVEKKHGKEICFAYFFLRNKSNNWPEADLLRSIKENSLWEDFEYSIHNLKKIVKKNLNEEYDSLKNYSDYFNPTIKINLFNKISLELSRFRDAFMLKKIKESLIRYNRIFIIKGVYHLNENEDKIRKLLENVKL